MAKTSQKGKTAEKFTSEIDNLRKLLEASYIDEGLPAEHADKFSTKEAITTMVKNCEHGRLKTILEAGNFTTKNEAVTKYAVLKWQAMQIQYCTHKEETTITVTTSEIITAVGAITEVIIGIKDITNILPMTKIKVIAESIIIRPTTIIEVVVIIEKTTDGIIIMSDRYKLRRKTNKDP